MTASVYADAFAAYTQVVQRAFVVAARRLDARREDVHRAVIASFRFDGADSCHIVVLVYREDGSEVRYGLRVYRSEIDGVSEAEIEGWAAQLAQRRYEHDLAIYVRIMGSDEGMQYLWGE